jgi:hypothetical protein
MRSNASLPAVRTATTPAADGDPGGKLGLGLRPLLVAMSHHDYNSAAASVAESRSLRRNQVESIVAISGARSYRCSSPLEGSNLALPLTSRSIRRRTAVLSSMISSSIMAVPFGPSAREPVPRVRRPFTVSAFERNT